MVVCPPQLDVYAVIVALICHHRRLCCSINWSIDKVLVRAACQRQTLWESLFSIGYYVAGPKRLPTERKFSSVNKYFRANLKIQFTER